MEILITLTMNLTIVNTKHLLSSLDHFKHVVLDYDKILDENVYLKQQLLETQEINKNFMSVSIIVNTKNENDKLNIELTLLKKKISYLEKQILDYKEQNIKLKKICCSVDKKDSDEHLNDDETELIEYNYNGTDYYVSDDNDKHVYAIDSDDEPSDEPIGYIGKENTLILYTRLN